MRVLILTCNTGEGHNSAAYAIKEEFEKRGDSCDISDALGYVSERLSRVVAVCHSNIYRYVPKAFQRGYSFSERHESIFSQRRLIYRWLASGAEGLSDAVIEGEYDLIICVHAFSAIMASEMRKRFLTYVPALFVSTDYTCSPSVAESDMDIYFIAHEGLMEEFEENGIPRDRLVPSGIPVKSAFYERPDRQKAKSEAGVPPDCRNVLLMCGSMGCGPVEDLARTLIKRLPGDCRLTVVCGTNEKLFRALSFIDSQNLKVLGYTKLVPQLLSASELIITKPGGLSISEAAAKGTPMLLIDVVGGCERRNLEYFSSQDWADTYPTTGELASACVFLLSEPERLERKAKALEKAFSGSAAEKICAAAQELLCAESSPAVRASAAR